MKVRNGCSLFEVVSHWRHLTSLFDQPLTRSYIIDWLRFRCASTYRLLIYRSLYPSTFSSDGIHR